MQQLADRFISTRIFVFIALFYDHLLIAETIETLDTSFFEAIKVELSEEDSPYSIYTLSAGDLEKRLSRNMIESLEGQPGVSIQKTSNGQGSPYLRGFTGYRTLAAIDGIRYNNAVYRDGPNEYFSLIDSQSIVGAELIQGPGSVLYGSDAIGGTLNLKTKESNFMSQNDAFINVSQRYRYSSAENSQILRSDVAFGEGAQWGLQLGYSWKDFGDTDAANLGIQKKTGYEEHAWDARFDLLLNNNWRLKIVHQSLNQDDVWRTHSTIFAKSFAMTDVGTDLRRFKDQKRSLNYMQILGEDLQSWVNQIKFTLSYQKWDEDGLRQRSNGSITNEFLDSRMFGIDLSFQSEIGKNSLSYGVDYYRDNVDSGRVDSNSNGSSSNERIQGPVGDDSSYDLFGIYAQNLVDVSQNLDLILGGRYTYARAEIGKYEDPETGNEASFDDSWQNFVASVRAIYGIDALNTWKIWGGVSQSFRAPNIADLSRYGGSRSNEIEIAAVGLKPEKFLTSEIGIKANTENYRFSASYYYTWIDDYITSTATGEIREGLNEVTKRNSAEGYIQGIEISAGYQIADEWNFSTNLTWLDGKLDSPDNANSNKIVTEPISRLMPLTFNAALRWTRSDARMWAEVGCLIADKADRLSSRDKQDTQRIPPGGTPGYKLVHLRGGYSINDNLDINLGIENLLDEAYRVHGSGSNEPGVGMIIEMTARF